MGFFSDVFDSVLGSKAESESSTVTNPDRVYEAQAPFLQNVWTRSQALSESQMAPGSGFNDTLNTQKQGWQNLMAGSSNPYLAGMAGNAMNQISNQFKEQIMPALLGGGNAAGQLGTERYGMLQDSAARTAAEAMARAGTDVYGRAWDSGLQGQIAALGQSGDVAGAAWQPLMRQAAITGSPAVLGQGGTTRAESTGGQSGILGNIVDAGGSSWFG